MASLSCYIHLSRAYVGHPQIPSCFLNVKYGRLVEGAPRSSGSLSLSSRKMQSSLSLSLSCTRVCKEVLAGFHDTTRKLVSYTWVRGRSCLFQPAERSDFFGSIFAGFYITFSCLLFQFCFLLIFVKFVLIFVEFCCVKMIVYVVKSDWLRYVFFYFYFFYVVYNIVCKINMIKVFFK